MAAIGIDFGTENTGAFIEYGGSFRQVGTAVVDQKHLPSYVQYDSAGDMRAVGLPAKRGINDYKKMTVFNVKRLLGRRFDDKNIQNFKNVLDLNGNYEIAPDPDGQVQIVLGRTRLYPEEVASEIIATIIKDGLDQYPDLIIDHIVISVPAAYDAPQREMTKKAALLAIGKLRAKKYGERLQLPDFSSKKIDEISEIQLVSEPTAALITYLAHRSKEKGDLSPATGNGTSEDNKYILIFDLGAGTLDITIGKIISVVNPFTGTDQPVIAVKKTHGNNFLGGRDMDDRLASWVEQKLIDQGRTVTPEIRFFIRENMEGIKIRLSERDSTRLTICDEGIDIPVTRTDLETAIRPLLDLLKTEIEKAIAEAEITTKDLDFIIPVGGPTRMPCVKKVLVDSSLPLFGLDTWDPMLAVAEGAARYATPDVNVEDKPGFDYCAAVEMFTNVLVPTRIINSSTDTVPIIKETDLIVRKPDSGVAEISICLVSRCGEGYKKINAIKIPTTRHGVTETKKLHYYSTLLNQYRDIEVHYGKIRMSWEITADGLLKKPAFTDPSTGISIDYPDIRIKDLGEVALTNKKVYQENWEKYANEDAQAFEKGFNETIDRIQQAYPSLTRPQAIKLYIDVIRDFENNNSFGKLREQTKERIAGARQAGVNPQLIDQWTRRLAAAQRDTEECRQELLGICLAIESAHSTS
ncbi:MAG: Hsp70 family protein [Methanoregula sp.]|nr:Hsp70 family protein [Methanoregula sp.]